MDLPVSIGDIVANKYRVDRVIGQGGMGIVVAAFHLELEQPVAIKFLNPEMGSRADAGERFRREARAAARIHSEHVARVLDIEVFEGRIPYMVMELLEGHDLEKELQLTGPLPVEVAVDYILQAIDAVAEAHAAGIVHRDLKPTNVFLATRSGGQRVVKVLDFGISKLTGPGWGPEPALTRSASIVGSPLYMSPEQMRSARDVDARSDIWSLGAMLYELVAGRPPYDAETIPALCMAILNAPPPLLREVAPAAPAALEAILVRCLARDPNERFSSVAELAQALVTLAPHASKHSERAQRFLSQPRVSPTGSSIPPPVVGARGSTPAAGTPRALQMPHGPTQSSWGKTGGRRAMVTKRTGTILGALVVIAVAAIATIRWLRSETPAEEVEATLHSATPMPSADTGAASSGAPSGSSVIAPREASSVSSPVPATAVSREAAAIDPAPETRSTRPGRRVPSTRPTRPATSSDKGSGELTDFGGRLY